MKGRDFEDLYFTVAVRAAHRLFVNGFDHLPQRAKADRIEFLTNLGPLHSFINQHCVVAASERESIEKNVFHRLLVSKVDDFDELKAPELGKLMKSIGFVGCRPSHPRPKPAVPVPAAPRPVFGPKPRPVFGVVPRPVFGLRQPQPVFGPPAAQAPPAKKKDTRAYRWKSLALNPQSSLYAEAELWRAKLKEDPLAIEL